MYSSRTTPCVGDRRRYILIILMVTLIPVAVFAQLAAGLEAVDDFLDAEEPDQAIARLETLEGDASTAAQRAEVYWRFSAATLMRGDQRDEAGASDDELLALYEAGEQYGQDAIAADAGNHLGYYWTSANIGRWGQIKGVMNSLFRAPDMRDLLTEAVTQEPEHADSYYVLGQLYAKVPGVVSFGNTEYAVSLARKSVDLMEAEVRSGERDEPTESFYVQLASHLIDRDWNSRQRRRKLSGIRDDYADANTPIERGFYYEGSISLDDVDDAREAETILRDVIRDIESIRTPSPSQRRQLEEARELMNAL